MAHRGHDQARLALDEAVAGFTREERGMAAGPAVAQAEAAVATLKAQVDRLAVTAPLAAQVFDANVEPGEVVSPGVPLLTLVDLGDVWLRFDLREDLVSGLKIGDRLRGAVPALGDRSPSTEVRRRSPPAANMPAGGQPAATGDFDLRTFEIRAYPIEPVPWAAAGHERLRGLEETAD